MSPAVWCCDFAFVLSCMYKNTPCISVLQKDWFWNCINSFPFHKFRYPVYDHSFIIDFLCYFFFAIIFDLCYISIGTSESLYIDTSYVLIISKSESNFDLVKIINLKIATAVGHI